MAQRVFRSLREIGRDQYRTCFQGCDAAITAMVDQKLARSSQRPSDEVRATWSVTAWGELGSKCSAPPLHRRALRAHMNFLECARNLPKRRSGIFV